MARIIVHVNPDNTVWLEGLAPGRPEPQGIPVIDHTDIPGKAVYCKWNGVRLIVDGTLKAAYEAIDRRPAQVRLMDLLVTKGVITQAEKDGL